MMITVLKIVVLRRNLRLMTFDVTTMNMRVNSRVQKRLHPTVLRQYKHFTPKGEAEAGPGTEAKPENTTAVISPGVSVCIS